MEFLRTIEECGICFINADHVDAKEVECDATLREFAAAMLSYMPGWMRFLYRVRKYVVSVLGMKQEEIPGKMDLEPSRLEMHPGGQVAFFTVKMADEDRFLVLETSDEHLSADLIIALEKTVGRVNRFHVCTIVHYKNWKGPVYFNLIRPFHHLVVALSCRNAVRTLS